MAGGLLIILDDAVAMTKIAAKKTAAILGDDLAVNAEKATGFHASRELPVLWAITKGSFINKLIILPIAFLLSAFAPWLIVPILLFGGAYLSYEGAEKVLEWLFEHEAHAPAVADESLTPAEVLEQESGKVKAAIKTDFILSIEIIVISLETVMAQSLMMQVLVVGVIAVLATVGVYGLVALLVRMDDMGFHLIQRAKEKRGMLAKVMHTTGKFILAALPKVIALLGVVGTVAMLLVGGGMFVHNIEMIHHALAIMPSLLAELLVGMIVGLIVIFMVKLKEKVFVKAAS
ncbi:MAG: DUF808 domain-containing protein [Mariprofundaceae bacterium]|nr:DUF808 domain-containing protein [Mariprofundaceae bacterium]